MGSEKGGGREIGWRNRLEVWKGLGEKQGARKIMAGEAIHGEQGLGNRKGDLWRVWYMGRGEEKEKE